MKMMFEEYGKVLVVVLVIVGAVIAGIFVAGGRDSRLADSGTQVVEQAKIEKGKALSKPSASDNA